MFEQKDKEFLRELISPLVIDICEIKVEMKEMRKDIDELKTDVAELKTDVSQLKSDVIVLRTDVDNLQQDMEQVRTRVRHTNILLENEISNQIGILRDGHKFLQDKMDMIININEDRKLLVARVNVLEGAFHRHTGMAPCEAI